MILSNTWTIARRGSHPHFYQNSQRDKMNLNRPWNKGHDSSMSVIPGLVSGYIVSPVVWLMKIRSIRVDYHGSKEVPRGTCDAILKAAGVKRRGKRMP